MELDQRVNLAVSPQERREQLEGIRAAETRAKAATRRLRALEHAFREDVMRTTPKCAPGTCCSALIGDDIYRCRVCLRNS